MISLDFDYSSSSKVANAEKVINQHFPYESFKAYFDCENILLTDYRESECHNAMAILKSYDGTTIAIDNCNCGYSGHGPCNTAAILTMIGISKDQSEQLTAEHSAIELYFDEKGRIIPYKTNLDHVFESRSLDVPFGKIDLREIDLSDPINRAMYLINPKGKQMLVLFQLIQVMQPTSFSYYVGCNNTRFINFPFQNLWLSQNKNFSEKLSFIAIKGNAFDTICFVDRNRAKTLINDIAVSLNSIAPFVETSVGKLSILLHEKRPQTKWDKLCAITKEILQPDEIYSQRSLKRK